MLTLQHRDRTTDEGARGKNALIFRTPLRFFARPGLVTSADAKASPCLGATGLTKGPATTSNDTAHGYLGSLHASLAPTTATST